MDRFDPLRRFPSPPHHLGRVDRHRVGSAPAATLQRGRPRADHRGLQRPRVSPLAERFAAPLHVDDCVWQGATGAKATWAIAARETDALLGNIAVMDLLGPNPTSGEIGYWLHPDARGRGVMTEATRLVVGHCLDAVGLDRRRLVLYAAAGNAASNAIAVAAGFSRYGTQRAAERLGDGSYDDLHGYELLR